MLPRVSKPALKNRAVSRSAFTRADAAGIAPRPRCAPHTPRCSVQPLLELGPRHGPECQINTGWINIVSSPRVGSASVTVLFKPAGLGLWR